MKLSMLDCVWVIKKGSRLRVDISSSSYPAYHVHPNTEEAWADATETDVAEQTVYFGANHPSKISLPIGQC